MRSKIFFIALILLFTKSSCDYELEMENYVKRNPPDNYVEIFIETLTPGDTMLVIEPVKFSYNFSLPGKKFDGAVFRLRNREWKIKDPSGFILIDPKELNIGFHTLELIFQFASGTGSLADQLNMEGYSANLDWTLLIQDSNISNIDLEYKINDDGFLEFNWKSFNYSNFDYYSLRIFSPDLDRDITVTINDINTTTYVDSCYFGGVLIVYFEVIVKGGATNPNLNPITIEENIPEISYEYYGADSLRIFWDKSKLARRYSLNVETDNGVTDYLLGSVDTFVVVPRMGFAQTAYFNLSIEPLYTDCGSMLFWKKPSTTRTITLSSSVRVPSFFLNDVLARSDFHYNHFDDVLIWRYGSDVFLLDPDSLSPLRTINLNSNKYLALCSDFYSSRFIIGNSSDLYVYKDRFDENPEFHPPFGAQYYSYLMITSKNQLAFSENNNLHIYDFNSGTVRKNVFSMGFYRGFISGDGDYFAYHRNMILELYELQENNTNLIYESKENVKSIIFNPLKSDQIIVSFFDASEIHVLKMPEMEVVKIIDVGNNIYLNNIDLATGLLLGTAFKEITDLHYHYIIDIESGSILCTLPTSDFNSKLHKNKLLSSKGLYMDISEYLK
jgi:hypothetical protein